MTIINGFLDQLFYGVIAPVFQFIASFFKLVLIEPFIWLHVPIWLHVGFIGVLTALLAFWFRSILKVEDKTRIFNEGFSKKRHKQQNLQFITEKFSREALYKVTDDELNNDFNIFLAHHYARYVLIYMLPIFMMLAWINTVFSETFLIQHRGTSFAVSFSDHYFGINGLSISCIFLLAYISTLIIGFSVKNSFFISGSA